MSDEIRGVAGLRIARMARFLDDIKNVMDEVAAREDKELGYIVIDPVTPEAAIYHMTDEGGRLFAQMHPSLVERLPKHNHPERHQLTVWGIPVFERHQLPEGWGVGVAR